MPATPWVSRTRESAAPVGSTSPIAGAIWTVVSPKAAFNYPAAWTLPTLVGLRQAAHRQSAGSRTGACI